jgi:hypothetical protein
MGENPVFPSETRLFQCFRLEALFRDLAQAGQKRLMLVTSTLPQSSQSLLIMTASWWYFFGIQPGISGL